MNISYYAGVYWILPSNKSQLLLLFVLVKWLSEAVSHSNDEDIFDVSD